MLGQPAWERNGFAGRVYRKITGESSEFVIAFRGWDNTDVNDIDDLTRIIVGDRLGSQYLPAFEFVEAVKAQFESLAPITSDNTVLTGHSLGGALASIFAVREGFSATVFNPIPSRDPAIQATEDVVVVDPVASPTQVTIPGAGDIANAENIQL